MLKIWGRNNSSNVQKVMWAVDELDLPHQRIDIGGAFGGNDKPEYLAKNPNGLVPTLEEGDFILWESNAILRYLAGVHGRLFPTEHKARAQVDKWLDWQTSVLGPVMVPMFWNLVRTPPEKRDHKAIEISKAKTTKAIKIVDDQLSRTAYLGADTFSIGDIGVAIMIYRYRALAPDRPAFPHLERWFAALSERPPFRRHVLDLGLS